ncbi:MAG: MBL fold metallo-hydrolase [Anaerofustis sp.]
MEQILNNITWYSQGALKIAYNKHTIYTDPFDIDKEYHDADYILISHSHFDHLSHENIAKVIKKDTVFIVPMSVSDELNRYVNHQIVEIVPFDVLNLEFMVLEAVPAYNIVKKDKHPRENDWVGYVMTLGDTVLYYTSDTELIPEMADIKADILFVPLGQTYTMNSVEDAAKAALITSAKTVVPIHYGKYEGSEEDAQKLKRLLSGKADVVFL